jgi:hypothetical protein
MGEGTMDNRHAVAEGSQATFKVTVPTKGKKRTTQGGDETIDAWKVKESWSK